MNKVLLIGIIVSVFVTGAAVSYAITYESGYKDMRHQPWVADPQHPKQMTDMMLKDHDFMMTMFSEMIEIPSIRLQIMGHLTDDPEIWKELQSMMSDSLLGKQHSNQTETP